MLINELILIPMSFVCEYLGFLKPLRHAILDLSREKHIKVLIPFVTIEIGAFHLSAIISANLVVKPNVFFSHTAICNKEPESEGPIFNLEGSIIIASFLFLLICSQALLSCHLTMSLSEEIKHCYVRKWSLTSRPEIECTDIETASLLLFAFFERYLLLTSWRISSFLTLTHTSSNSSEVISLTSLCLNMKKPPFLQNRACLTSNDAPQIHWDGILSSG